MTSRTRQDILADVEDAIREIMLQDARSGANDYACVTVYSDGQVTSGREASYCVSESEYFGTENHPVTVWSTQGFRESAGFSDEVFEWEEVEAPADLTEEEIENGFRHGGRDSEDLNCESGTWYRLTDVLLNEFDLSEIMREVEQRLDEHAWMPAE